MSSCMHSGTRSTRSQRGLRALGLAALFLLLCLGAAGKGPAPAAPPVRLIPLPTAAAVPAVKTCASLALLDLTVLPEAATHITHADETKFREVPICFVQGYIAPQIQFELRLPLEGYTGRYLQTGCGGNCGVIATNVSPACDEAVAYGSGFAVATDNTGHVGR